MPASDTTPSTRYKALSHPTRVRILRALEPGRSASPRQLADELDIPLPQLSYHVRRLAELEFLELVEVRPRRGAIEHFYRASARPTYDNEQWAQLPTNERRTITQEVVAAIWSDIAAASAAETLDSRTDRHITRSPLQLDDEGWREIEERLCAVMEDAHEIAASAVNRVASGASEAVPARLILLLFEAAPKGA